MGRLGGGRSEWEPAMIFKPEITTGTILTLITMVCGVFMAWSDINAEVAKLKTETASLHKVDAEIKEANQEMKREIIKRLDDLKVDFRDLKSDIRTDQKTASQH
jgi:hypothetical protein